MRNIFIFAFVSALLMGCGGGSGGGTTESVSASSTQGGTLCGVDVGAKLLEGSVTDVHDGDTITLAVAGTSFKIRLDSIDAPELAQPVGSLSQKILADAVLGKSVKVAYTKMDQYGRVVGAVFTENCQYINLNQVAAGMAWFYKAYQCEVSATVRTQFSQAQDSAVGAQIGLWAQSNPEAPWFYRNGAEPVTPTCTSDSPTWSGNSALTSVSSTTPANSSTPVTVPTSPPISTTCYTGPRGGTYTISASGNKNYGGC